MRTSLDNLAFKMHYIILHNIDLFYTQLTAEKNVPHYFYNVAIIVLKKLIKKDNAP